MLLIYAGILTVPPLRELGKLERTIFTLDWLRDPDLRRRSHVGLNKGEQQNALRRAVFFNRLGEIRARSYENQPYRASGLNLLVAAIILWNTVYLQRAVDHLRKQGIEPGPNDFGAPVAARLGAHQPDRRLSLAQQLQGRRGQIQAVTTASESLTGFKFRILRRPHVEDFHLTVT